MNKDKIQEAKKILDEFMGTEWLSDLKGDIKFIKQFKDEQEKVGTTLSTIAENLPKSMVILNVKEELKKYFKDLVKEFDTSIKDFKSSDKQKEIVKSLTDLQGILKENKNKEELQDVITELDEQIKGIQTLNKLLTEIKDKDNTVKVENMPSFDTKELQEVILNSNVDIKEAIENIVNKVQPVLVENNSINEALPVKLVSTDNRFYTAKSGGGGGASGLPFSQDITGDNVGYGLIDGQGHLQVDVLSGGGGGSQYAEDTAHTTGDLGTGALVVRADTPASLCDTDGDYSLLIVDANGRLHVLDKNSDDIKSNLDNIDTKLVSDTIGDDILATEKGLVMKAVLFGKGSGGATDYQAIDVTNGGNMKIAIEEFDPSVSLPAGTNSIGKLGANSGVDIGDVTLNNTNLDVTTALEGRTILKSTVDFTASQTAQTIIDPTAGKKFVISSYVISCTTAGLITIFDETNDTTNRIAKHDLSANTSGNVTFPLPIQSSTADNILKYTTGTAVGYLTVYYYEI